MIDTPTESQRPAEVIGRYMLHRQIARGGMATIHIARLMGDEGFSRIVAAKRLHPEFAQDADFVAMFLDEARVASKVHHHNVVPVLDVVTTGTEVVLVQEYVHGVPLSWLLRTAHEAKVHIPIPIAVSIACQVLAGLQAAHHTVDELGMALDIVHRDVSPQNVMIATDGAARLLDFGVAKAAMSAHITRDGTFKGKLAYSAPEAVRGQATQQSDLYALSVVLWELLVGQRLHGTAQGEAQLIYEIMSGSLPTITSALAPEREWLGEARWAELQALEPVIQRGLATQASDRWHSAEELAAELAAAVTPASSTDVAAWLKSLGKDFLSGRDRVIAAEEASWRRSAAALAGTAPVTELDRPAKLPIVSRMRFSAKHIVAGLVVAFFMIVMLIVELAREPSVELPARLAPVASMPPPPPIIATPVAAPAPQPAPADSVAPPPPRLPPPVARIAVPQRPHLVPRPVVRQVQPPPPVMSAPAAPAAATVDCTLPYYFEGAKKIFKSACL